MDDYESMDSFFQGFMVDQRQRIGGDAELAVANGASKKELFTGTQAGTNGLRVGTNSAGDHDAMTAGDNAARGVGAM